MGFLNMRSCVGKGEDDVFLLLLMKRRVSMKLCKWDKHKKLKKIY